MTSSGTGGKDSCRTSAISLYPVTKVRTELCRVSQGSGSTPSPPRELNEIPGVLYSNNTMTKLRNESKKPLPGVCRDALNRSANT